ncbi:hypothetical protein NHH82_27195 [Oxalobacteraceae bacterium OTU3REALA1]|nr:hypothetical protein NHH82_27195 [Oxalobacteraceae bacterium OTU3REALA1]
MRFLMPEGLIDVLAVIFLDNFWLATGCWLTLLAVLASKKFLRIDYPYIVAISSWVVLLVLAIVVAAVLTTKFFSYGQGLERLALVVYFLGAGPLFVCAILAAFLFPQKAVDSSSLP